MGSVYGERVYKGTLQNNCKAPFVQGSHCQSACIARFEKMFVPRWQRAHGFGGPFTVILGKTFWPKTHGSRLRTELYLFVAKRFPCCLCLVGSSSSCAGQARPESFRWKMLATRKAEMSEDDVIAGTKVRQRPMLRQYGCATHTQMC